MQKPFILWFKDLDKWQIPRKVLTPVGLPRGWRIVRVADFAHRVTERVRVASGKKYNMLGVKWYAQGVFLRETVDGDSMSATWVTPAKPGAFIYNRLFAWKESFAVVPPDYEGCFVSGEFPQFTLDSTQIIAEYLYLLFTLKSVIRAVNAASAGSAAVSRNRFKEEEFLRMELPIPPMETQRKIFAEWQKAREMIAMAEERAESIKAEMDAQFFSDLGLKLPAIEAVPKVLAVEWTQCHRWSVSYNQMALAGMDITRGLFPPVPLDSILQLVQYGTSEKANTRKDGVPVIRMNNILDGMLDLSDLKHIDLPQKVRQRLVLQDGDILFNRTNSKELVGKCAVFHDSGEYVFASYLIRVRVQPERANPDYVVHTLNSPLGRQQINALSPPITRPANVNSEELRSIQIPLPPLDEQLRIIKKIVEGRSHIARERELARSMARRIEEDVEAYLLGTKKVSAP